MAVKLTPEQHLRYVQSIEELAARTTNPEHKTKLEHLAMIGKFVTRMAFKARAKVAVDLAEAAIAKARRQARGGEL
jgi:hypothetical protein